MATKDVLNKAIERLRKNTEVLLEKQSSVSDEEKQAIKKKIARNESMILDYKFRIEKDDTVNCRP